MINPVMKELIKVTAYITCNQHLLVFRHVDHPEAGIQVPAGSVDRGETLDEAVLREAKEESGLEDLYLKAYLGALTYTFHTDGDKPLPIQRHYYHLIWPGPIKESTWRHWELSPSEGDEDKLLFELFWVDLKEVPALGGKLADKLHLINGTSREAIMNDTN